MIKIAIRDDDANYFTKVNDLVNLYSPIGFFPISYAVIPLVTDVSTRGICPDTKGNRIPEYIGNNNELVSFFKEQLKNQTCDILLHGITHEYKFNSKGCRLAEMEWRTASESEELIKKYLKDLSELFAHLITCFVAPSNKISKNNIRSVYKNGLDYSGIISVNFNRDINFRSLSNYVKRWTIRFYGEIPYPGILDYGTHKEINACILQSKDYLEKIFSYCCENGSPMVINTHYWHLINNPDSQKMLFNFIDYAQSKGAIPSTVSACLVSNK